MASTHDTMLYIVQNYPFPDDLSNARLTKLIYLADWRSALKTGRQITGLAWSFHHYGPFLHDIINEARRSQDFDVREEQTMYGTSKQLISARPGVPAVRLNADEEGAIDHVIAQTSDLNWSQFIELVYSTYPIVKQDRYTDLDLESLASEYQSLKRRLRGA